MNATQKQRAMNAFAEDCEITNYYFGLVDDMIEPIVDDDGERVSNYELSNDGFNEILQGPTCAIGALIVDLWKGGELTSESVENVMLKTNDAGYTGLPSEVQETLERVYGISTYQFSDIQDTNDRVNADNTVRSHGDGYQDMHELYSDHINTRESLVISTLLNFEESNA